MSGRLLAAHMCSPSTPWESAGKRTRFPPESLYSSGLTCTNAGVSKQKVCRGDGAPVASEARHYSTEVLGDDR